MIARKFRTFRQLDPGLRPLVLEAIVLPLLIRVGFSVLGIPKAPQLLARWAGAKAAKAPERPVDLIVAATRAQRIVKRSLGIEGTCLVRSLALQAMLRRRGVETSLRIGVRKVETALEGHAWLEHDGRPINEVPEVVSTYVLFEGADALMNWRTLR